MYGLERHPLVDLVDKDDVPDLEVKLADLDAGLRRVNAVVIRGADNAGIEFRRAIGMYALSSGHDSAEVIMASGLSGAGVGRVMLTGNGETPAWIFLKTARHDNATEEYQRYRKYVANRLAPGWFAAMHEPMSAGLGRSSALVSTLASDARSLFEVLRDDPDAGPEVVQSLRAGLLPWTGSVRGKSSRSLRDLRRVRLQDEKLSKDLAAMDLATTIESHTLEMSEVICHGDLHGENVLIDSVGRPMLIDFADAGPGYAPTDPVTLELSVLFHREGPARDPLLGSDLAWAEWADIDAFVGSSPLGTFLRAVRGWALEVSTEREVFAFAYAHALRQVKYEDVDNAQALLVAAAAAARLAELDRT